MSQAIENMQKYGGNFAKALAATWQCADPDNKMKIETAFADLFAKYDEFLNQKKETE